ncbi:hypothetical protein H696_04047, partial [Fonticula alba]
MPSPDAPITVGVLFYCRTGCTFRLVQHLCAGINAIPGVRALPALVSDSRRLKEEYLAHQDAIMAAIERDLVASGEFAYPGAEVIPWKSIPLVDLNFLSQVDALLVGGPVYAGSLAAPVHGFWDLLAHSNPRGALAGKLAAPFATVSSALDGGESACLDLFSVLSSFGMTVVTLGYLDPAMSSGSTLSTVSALVAQVGQRVDQRVFFRDLSVSWQLDEFTQRTRLSAEDARVAFKTGQLMAGTAKLSRLGASA